MTPRALAQWLAHAAIDACSPRERVAAYLRAHPPAGSLSVLAVGKAAPVMAQGLVDVVPSAAVLVIAPDGTPIDLPANCEVMRAAHPHPDQRSVAAGQRAIDFVEAAVQRGDCVVALISGGASALLCAPIAGMSVEEKSARIAALMAAGAPIAEINRARAGLSRIKGGQLAARVPGPLLTLIASDVVGDDPAVVGSGPTISSRAGHVVEVLLPLASVRSEAAALARAYRDSEGVPLTVVEHAEVLVGDVAGVAERIAATALADPLPPLRGARAVHLWCGEPTIALPPTRGKSGRAHHLALTLALELAGHADLGALVVGTDGVDGDSGTAGAWIDGTTSAALAKGGIEPSAALAAADAARVLGAVGASVGMGPGGVAIPTGVNHADLVVLVRGSMW